MGIMFSSKICLATYAAELIRSARAVKRELTEGDTIEVLFLLHTGDLKYRPIKPSLGTIVSHSKPNHIMSPVLLSLHAANSYILLTANLDDVQSLAKQIASSPVANQINDIILRASSIFNEHQKFDSESKAQMRTDPKLDEDRPPIKRGQEKLEATEKSQRNPSERRESTKKSDATPAYNVEVWTPDKEALAAELEAKMSDSSSGSSGEANEVGAKPHRILRRHNPDVAELGRNASFYLKSIKKIFEGF